MLGTDGSYMLHAGSLQAHSPLQSEAPPLASNDAETPAPAPAVLGLYDQQHVAAHSSGVSHGAVAGIAGKPLKSDAAECEMPLNPRLLKGEMPSKLPFGCPSLRGRGESTTSKLLYQLTASPCAAVLPFCRVKSECTNACTKHMQRQ